MDRDRKSDRSAPGLSYPGQRKCRFCAAPVDRLQAGTGVCNRTACETRRVQEAARAVYKRTWNQYVGRQHRGVARNGAEIVAAARLLGVEPDEMNVGVVPRQNRGLAPLPSERRAAFAEHLAGIVAESFEKSVPGPGEQRREQNEPPEVALFSAACATCQGHCCTMGGETHAFMTCDTIDAYRRRFPEHDAQAVTDTYLGAVPDRSVEHSCVFHGPVGCVLERTVRSDLCNAYQCNPKRELAKRLSVTGANRGAWIAAEDQTDTVIAIYDPKDGYRNVVADAGLGDTDPAAVAAMQSAVLQTLPKKMVEQDPPDAVPGLPTCSWCGAPIDAQQAAASGYCSAAACEHARRRDVRGRE